MNKKIGTMFPHSIMERMEHKKKEFDGIVDSIAVELPVTLILYKQFG